MDSLDHVIVCVPDLDRAVHTFESEHGVSSVVGGRHAGHGTANRIVPLGDAYVELVAVLDRGEAAGSVFGRWVEERSSRSGADGVAIRTDDLDAVCDRLRLEPRSMTRRTAADEELRWRVAGMEHMVDKGMPFFIQWDTEPGLHPARIHADHPAGEVGLGQVAVHGDREGLQKGMGAVRGVGVGSGEPHVTFEITLR